MRKEPARPPRIEITPVADDPVGARDRGSLARATTAPLRPRSADRVQQRVPVPQRRQMSCGRGLRSMIDARAASLPSSARGARARARARFAAPPGRERERLARAARVRVSARAPRAAQSLRRAPRAARAGVSTSRREESGRPADWQPADDLVSPADARRSGQPTSASRGARRGRARGIAKNRLEPPPHSRPPRCLRCAASQFAAKLSPRVLGRGDLWRIAATWTADHHRRDRMAIARICSEQPDTTSTHRRCSRRAGIAGPGRARHGTAEVGPAAPPLARQLSTSAAARREADDEPRSTRRWAPAPELGSPSPAPRLGRRARRTAALMKISSQHERGAAMASTAFWPAGRCRSRTRPTRGRSGRAASR